MDRADRLVSLLHDLYAAPGNPPAWLQFLENLRVALHGSAGTLITKDAGSDECGILLSTNVDPEAWRSYDQQWGAVDPWAHSPKAPLLLQRSVVVGDELIGHRDMQRTAYYADYARRYDMVRALVGVLAVDAASLSVITVSGSEGRGGFEHGDVELLEPLVPHIRRAVNLHRRLIEANRLAGDFAEALERLSHAVLLIDAGGRVRFTNQAAGKLLALRDGLFIEDGEIRAACASDTARLRTILGDAIGTSRGAIRGADSILAIGRPSGARPFIVSVSPAGQRYRVFTGDEPPSAIVFVSDPDQTAVADADTLRRMFALTPAESALAALIAQGSSLADAAARLGVTRETARSRLKRIFEKTDTHRQADLVRLLTNTRTT